MQPAKIPAGTAGRAHHAAQFNFGLNSDMCETLAAFETAGSIAKLAELTKRDISVVSRQLQRIAKAAPVLEKQQGRWRLTALGLRLSHWTQDAATTQRRILEQQTVLRIATTREFAARVLAPRLAQFLEKREDVALSIIASEDGVERLLLEGRADVGFDCGSPVEPAIRFKTVTDEAFSVVAAKAFIAKHKVKRPADLLPLPHLQYQRASAPKVMQLSYDVPHVLASFNDIATIREAAIAGLGWAVLPTYAIRRELDAGTLRAMPGWKIRNERFGIWWLRERTDMQPWIQRATVWLGKQQLG